MAGRYRTSFTTDVQSVVFLVVAILWSGTEAQCNGTKELTAWPYFNSSLSSPNYPLPYPGYARCSWLLRTMSPGYILKLDVINLNLEYENSCSYDILAIFDGGSSVSRRLGRLCGNVKNVTYYSTGSAMFVSFTSDSSREFSGFSIVYSAVLSAVTTSPAYSPPWTTTNDETETQCSGTTELTAWPNFNNWLSSPNYPLPYPAHASCSWLLRTTSPGYILKIDVTELSLESENSCRYDNLTIFDGDSKFSRRIAVLCGSRRRQIFYSSGSTALISFTSDAYEEDRGFRITYAAVPSAISTPRPWLITTTMPTDGLTSSVCVSGSNGGTTLTATTWSMKYLQSPNYPGNYPNNAKCAWTLLTDPGYLIHVQVIDMDLEVSGDCSYDAVTFYDASMELSSYWLATLCNTSYVREYYSTGSSMFITFKSDMSFTSAGFRLMYEATQTRPTFPPTTALDCISADNGGATLIARTWSMSYIQSPNYPGRYSYDARCAWKLTTDPGYVIHVRVINMDLEVTPGCNYDAVTLYDSSWETDTTPLATLCSTSQDSDYYSTGMYMFITFKSYSSNVRTGFQLMYEAVPAPASTEQPFQFASRSPVRTGIIVGIVAGAIVFAGLFVVIVLIFKRRQNALKRSRRAQNGRRYELPPYTTPSSHFVFGETVLGPPGSAPAVGGQQAYTNAGYVHHEGYGPPPAYADLHDIGRIPCASNFYVMHRNSSLDNVGAQGGRIGSGRDAANPENGDTRAKESLEVLAPPSYESLNLVQAETPGTAPPLEAAAAAARPLPSLPLSA